MDTLLDDAREAFETDLFATKQAGIVIDEVGGDYAKCSMKINETHMNAEGFVMGGAIFTLADFSFAVAANAVNSVTVTLSSNINFLSGTKSSVLYAESVCKRRGNAVCFFETTVTDVKGKIIATVASNGFRRAPKP